MFQVNSLNFKRVRDITISTYRAGTKDKNGSFGAIDGTTADFDENFLAYVFFVATRRSLSKKISSKSVFEDFRVGVRCTLNRQGFLTPTIRLYSFEVAFKRTVRTADF